MKLKLLRCSICDFWYAPFREHCPSCGASIGCVLHGKIVHVDVASGRQLVKGFYTYRMEGKTFEVIKERA